MERDERIEQKLDKIVDKIASIDQTLAAHHEGLKFHVKRTNVLEKKVDQAEAHINRVNGAFKVLGSLGVIFSLFKFLNK